MCGMPDPKHCCLDIEIGVIQEFCIHWIDSCIEFFHPRYSFGTCFLQIAPPNMSNLRIHTVGRHHAIADTHVNTFLWSTWKFWFETLESRLTWVVSNASDVWWWKKKTVFESSKICGAKVGELKCLTFEGKSVARFVTLKIKAKIFHRK